jgi:hypothetical protein
MNRALNRSISVRMMESINASLVRVVLCSSEQG